MCSMRGVRFADLSRSFVGCRMERKHSREVKAGLWVAYDIKVMFFSL